MTDVVPPASAPGSLPGADPSAGDAAGAEHAPPRVDAKGPPSRTRWWHREHDTRKTPDRPCLNCGNDAVGFFCPHCGQRKVDMRVSLRRMLMEVMEDQLSVNSTLPRTLKALFVQPGHLTQEYVQGKVARYVPPFRLYLVSSLVFFILLPLLGGIENLNVSIQDEARADSIRIAAQVDSVLLARARATGQDTTPFVRSPGAPGLSITLGPPPDRVPALLRPLARRSKETEERLNGMRRREAVGTLRDAFVDNAPTGIFLMMPLFALILKLLYARRKRFYVEHFVFALHVHSFAFLLLTVMMVLKWEWLNALLSLWFIVALYIAMKRVYGQGWFKTLVKYLVLAQAYGLILIVGVTITIVLATLTV